jgi:hypothetical protein
VGVGPGTLVGTGGRYRVCPGVTSGLTKQFPWIIRKIFALFAWAIEVSVSPWRTRYVVHPTGTGQARVGIGVAEGLGVTDGPGVLDAEWVGEAGTGVSDALGGTVVMTTGVVSATSVGVGPLDSCEASNPPASTVATTTMPVAIPPRSCRPPL